MIRLVLALIALSNPALSTPALSDTARVLSGEHGAFTRLVIELPGETGWRMGRLGQGYAFATDRTEQPMFDLTGVWQRIDKARLAALDVDPVSGRLQLQLACDCHVFPFEYQPGVIVLDIRPGEAPVASAFEADFVVPAVVRDAGEGRPETGAYTWLTPDLTPGLTSGLTPGRTGVPSEKVAGLPLPLATGPVSLGPLRDALLEEVARGAADGVVDMALPLPGRSGAAPDLSGPLPWATLRIGEAPGLAVMDPDAFVEATLPMAACTPDPMLDVTAWGEGKTALEVLAEARTGLYGEFDAPDPEAVTRSVRQLLYLGFGAEARQHAALFPDGAEAGDLEIYRSVARIIDLETDPETPFAAMLDCDGAAALWAALARDRLPFGPGVNRDAILRAFQALPPHLRRHLGPALAEKFLALADADAARMIRDAVERTPEADPATLALMDASAKLHHGDSAGAVQDAETAMTLAGGDAASLVTLIEAHLEALRPVEPEVTLALQAVSGESRGTGAGPAVERALVLALALSGQTDAAFQEPAATDAVLGDLWRVAAVRASDDDFLRHAVLPETDPPDGVAADVRETIADRLLTLGFPDAALAWIGPVGPGDGGDLRLLAAEAELARDNASQAVALLQGLTGPKADALRAGALQQLGDLPAAETALIAAGDPAKATRLALWEADWSDPSPEALDPASPWHPAARHAAAAPMPATGGLLARGTALALQAQDAEAAIKALLLSVPSPDPD
jgi:hypothetical protein